MRKFFFLYAEGSKLFLRKAVYRKLFCSYFSIFFQRKWSNASTAILKSSDVEQNSQRCVSTNRREIIDFFCDPDRQIFKLFLLEIFCKNKLLKNLEQNGIQKSKKGVFGPFMGALNKSRAHEAHPF